jgi:hypothetical protein
MAWLGAWGATDMHDTPGICVEDGRGGTHTSCSGCSLVVLELEILQVYKANRITISLNMELTVRNDHWCGWW